MLQIFRRHSVIRLLHTRHLSLPPTIKQVLENPGDGSINISGHIKAIRKFKKVGFLDLTDGSTSQSLPIVFKDPENVLEQYNFKLGQSVQISGDIIESKGTQAFEVEFDPSKSNHNLKIIGDVEDTYPIQKKEMTLSYLRNHSTLRHRTSTLASVLRFRSVLEERLIKFFHKHDFVKVTPPMLTSADCEGAGEQFVVKPLHPKTVDGVEQHFFGTPAYLTVSTQLHLEALAPSLNRVWTLTPCFRAEESNTNRHLSEFWMLEAEISYITELKQLTQFTEEMIKSVADTVDSDLMASRYNKQDKELIEQRWAALKTPNWPSITYTEAIDIINRIKLKGRLKGRLSWGDSILTENEKWLAGDHYKSPVFITDYPQSQKPFYMPKSADFSENKPTVACFDLIFPVIGELIGGSMREHNYTNLVEEMKSRGMNLKDMEWYLSTRINGTVPHGGFGMGFERLIMYLSGLDNLRDIVTFPRAPETCDC